MADTREAENGWENEPKAAMIKVLTISADAVVLVFRQPDGTWSAEMNVRPSGGFKTCKDAMEASEAFARQWKRGLL